MWAASAELYLHNTCKLICDFGYAVSCAGNMTLEGYSVDSCVNNGTDCGAAAADAFCNYLGKQIMTISAPASDLVSHVHATRHP